MMMKHLLLFLLPIQVFSQDLPVGFVNFHIPRINQYYLDLSVRYDLYTDSKGDDDSYYGYLYYTGFPGEHLSIHLKDTLSKPDSIIPSVEYRRIFTSHPRNTLDTVYTADEDSFFTVNKKEGNAVRFALNPSKDLWVKTGTNVFYFNPEDFLTKVNPYAYADPDIKLYSKPDTNSLIKKKTKFFCFRILRVENNWAYGTTKEGGDCADFSNTGVKAAWFIWYDKKLLIEPHD
jgi:hypothetical protein